MKRVSQDVFDQFIQRTTTATEDKDSCESAFKDVAMITFWQKPSVRDKNSTQGNTANLS